MPVPPVPTPPAPGTAVEDHIPAGFPKPEEDPIELGAGPLSPPAGPQQDEVEVPVDFNAPELDFDQKPEGEKKPDVSQEDEEDILDIIEPKAEPHLWRIGPEGAEEEYIQKPLTFIGKMKWFSLVGDALDKALTGDNAISLNSFFEAPTGRPGELRAGDFRDADTFVQAIGKLLAVAPDFLTDSYCIWLGVPEYDRRRVAEIMEVTLTDDDGMEIIEIFLDQNYEALASFFGERIGRLQRRVEALNKIRALNKVRASRR
jgi:hypothetical protein